MYHLSTQEKIQLQAAPLGTGGEGTVFAIKSPAQYQGYVAKIYHPTERKPAREAKIKHLIGNPLDLQDTLSFIFPKEIIYEDGEFVGYLMLRARGEYDLTVLSSLTLSNKLSEDWVAQYRRDKPENLRNYQKIAHHLALAFAEFYQQEEYIFTDLKPENIKVNLQGKISVIDLDSLQIQQNGKVLFPAEKISQEYSPPEREIFKEGEVISSAWTYFSMSVILYKLLLGLHPFSVTGKGDLRRLTTLADKMEYGLFPFGQHSDKIEVVPAPHHNFKSLPQAWQDLFTQSQATFLTQPEYRPNAQAWAAALQIKTLALREYKNPLSKRRTENIQKAGEFILPQPIKYSNMFNSMLGLGVALNLLNLKSLFDLTGSYLFFVLLIPALVFALSGITDLFQRNNFRIDPLNEEFWIKQKNLFGYEKIKKIPLRKLRVMLKEVWLVKPSIALNIYQRKKWILKPELLSLWASKKSKKGQVIKTLVKELRKYNVPIECEGIDLDEFLREG